MLLSRHYPPSPALEPYIARHYVFTAELPADFTMVDHLLSETAFIRILIRGDWAGETAPGVWSRPGNVLFFGSNFMPMRVRVRGPFDVVGVALRPCGWKALMNRPAVAFTDRMLRLADVWDQSTEDSFAAAGALGNDAAIVSACEAAILARLSAAPVNAPMRAFEAIARNDSTMRVEDIAARLGISARQFARLSVTHFGGTPKMVLRRSRFLDMATVIRGLGDPTDEYLSALRFFDQSHKTREFRRFINMTPSEFQKIPTPLLTAGLELRQERKSGVFQDSGGR